MSQSEVTVVIPNYNSEKLIEKTISSLLNQTYQNFLLYVVDDGSTDNSLKIIQEYENEIQRLKIFPLDNIGITKNWNRSIKLVETDFFTLLHCDDEYEPDYLQEMIMLMKSCPEAAIGHCVSRGIDEDSNYLDSPAETYKSARYFPADIRQRSIQDEYLLLMKEDYLTCPSVIFRKKDVDLVGLFNEEFKMVQDWEYWLRVLQSGRQICFTSKPLFKYRRHQNNATRNFSKSKLRYSEEFHLLNWAHQTGIAKEIIPATCKSDLTLVYKSVSLDIMEDLLNSKPEEASEKLDFLKEKSEQGHFNFIIFVLKIMKSFGRFGGLMLSGLLKLYLLAIKINYHKKVK